VEGGLNFVRRYGVDRDRHSLSNGRDCGCMISVQSEKVDRLRKRLDPHARYARISQYIISVHKYGVFASRPIHLGLGRCCIRATTLRGDWPRWMDHNVSMTWSLQPPPSSRPWVPASGLDHRSRPG
jgi:hypothetical protein